MANIKGEQEFDEDVYLQANPDVALAVEKGRIRSGEQHYRLFGKAEGRPIDLLSAEPNEIHRRWINFSQRPKLAILGDLDFAIGRRRSSIMAKMISYGRWNIVPEHDATRVLVFDPSCEIRREGAINGGGFSSAKDHVSAIFERVFDRSLSVDPAVHNGGMVVKHRTINGKHDGRSIVGPAVIAHDEVAQRLVSNCLDGMIQDIRVPYIAGNLPFVYFKYRPIETRFSNTNATVVLSSVQAAFSPAEIEQIRSFAKLAHLDFGEIDILRDRETGEIFIVDVNNTPVGPPNGLSKDESSVAVRLLTAAFEQSFLNGTVGATA